MPSHQYGIFLPTNIVKQRVTKKQTDPIHRGWPQSSLFVIPFAVCPAVFLWRNHGFFTKRSGRLIRKFVQKTSSNLTKMAAAHTKQLEERLDRYERILRGCPRCTAALALEESEDPTPPPPLPVAPRPAGSSLQKTPRISSTASALSSEKPMPTTRQGQSTRSSKQTASTSRSIPPASGVDVVDPASSVSASASGSGKKANPSQDTVRASSRLSKQTTVDAVPSLPGSLSKTQAFTAYPLNPRPTTLKPSTSGVDTQSARTSRPNTGGPSLSRSDSDSRRSRKDPQKQAAWKTAADKMLGEVPLGWVWHARIFGEGKSMLAAVTIDADAVPDDIIGSADVTHNQGRLLRLVRGFAHRHSDKRVNFQHFLLACLCRVLSAQEVPRNSIVETLQICISDSSEGNVNKYLQGARWANELMSRLFFTDWRYRAIDLIVLCMYAKEGLGPHANE